jgi:hypothetical protein
MSSSSSSKKRKLGNRSSSTQQQDSSGGKKSDTEKMKMRKQNCRCDHCLAVICQESIVRRDCRNAELWFYKSTFEPDDPKYQDWHKTTYRPFYWRWKKCDSHSDVWQMSLKHCSRTQHLRKPKRILNLIMRKWKLDNEGIEWANIKKNTVAFVPQSLHDATELVLADLSHKAYDDGYGPDQCQDGCELKEILVYDRKCGSAAGERVANKKRKLDDDDSTEEESSDSNSNDDDANEDEEDDGGEKNDTHARKFKGKRNTAE